MDYLIYGEIPASSTPRQIPPVDSIYRPRFSYRYSKHFEGRKVGFWRIFSGTDWQYVKLNNFNLRTYNDKSEMDYPIYSWMPASSKISSNFTGRFWIIASNLIIDSPIASGIERQGFDGISLA